MPGVGVSLIAFRTHEQPNRFQNPLSRLLVRFAGLDPSEGENTHFTVRSHKFRKHCTLREIRNDQIGPKFRPSGGDEESGQWSGETDTAREIETENGSVTQTAQEIETAIVAATETESTTRERGGPVSHLIIVGQ